jgi:hypothetical protein
VASWAIKPWSPSTFVPNNILQRLKWFFRAPVLSPAINDDEMTHELHNDCKNSTKMSCFHTPFVKYRMLLF